MNKEIIIRSINSAVDFALLHDGKLIELHKEKDNNKTEDNKNVSVIEKSQNFINKINQTGFKADLSGVGFEKTFGKKDQGLSATVYGQQDFGKPAEYGAKLGFNYKF